MAYLSGQWWEKHAEVILDADGTSALRVRGLVTVRPLKKGESVHLPHFDWSVSRDGDRLDTLRTACISTWGKGISGLTHRTVDDVRAALTCQKCLRAFDKDSAARARQRQVDLLDADDKATPRRAALDALAALAANDPEVRATLAALAQPPYVRDVERGVRVREFDARFRPQRDVEGW